MFVFIAGILMLLKIPGLEGITRYAYTLFDLKVIGILMGL